VTMREKLIARVWECGYPDFPLDPDQTDEMGSNWAEEIVDAILAELREPDEGMHEAGAEIITAGAMLGPGKPLPTLRNAFTAMIDHIRSGK
jgi:hypothetical protein